jgi:glutamate dehydrogenase/leucine dehydrogenase
MTNQELLEAECDILVPAAVQSVITGENASNVKAGLIVEVANGPVTPEGEDILERKGVTIIPDVIANCGSAIACSFERIQGLTDDYWELDKVLQKLDERIIKAYRQAVSTSNEKNVSLRTAAWVNAVNRVAGAMKMRGWV